MELAWTVEPGRRGRLDEEVGPAVVVGVVGEVELFGEEGGAEGQVALGVGADRVQVDTEGRRGQRCHPVGLHGREVVLGEQTAAELEQALPEGAAVEAVAPAHGEPGEHERGARSADDRSGRGRLRGQFGEVRSALGIQTSERPDQQRARREPVGGESTGRAENDLEGE